MNDVSLMQGEDYTYSGTDGHVVTVSNGTSTLQETVAQGMASFSLSVGHWWVSVNNGTRVQYIGKVVVNPPADAEEIRLRKEISDLDEEISDLRETLRTQVADGNAGTTETRTNLTNLRMVRAKASSVLSDYLRQRSGGSLLT